MLQSTTIKSMPPNRSSMFRIIFFLLLSFHALVAEVLIDTYTSSIPLRDALYFHEDPSGTMDIEKALSSTYSKLPEGSPNFGFTSSAYWIKTSVSFDAAEKEELWWLSIGYPLLDHIDLYIINESNGHRVLTRGGDLLPKEELEFEKRYFDFRLPFKENTTYTLLLRVKTQGSLQVPMTIKSNNDFIFNQQIKWVFTGLYYGVFLIIFFYNLILYLYTRELNYGLYLFFISSMAMWQLSLDGLGIIYLWPNWELMIEKGVPLSTSLIMFFSLLFGKVFLQTKKYIPSLDRWISLFMFLALLTFLASMFLPYHYTIRAIALFTLIVPVLLLSAGILVVRKDFYPARFYVAGWSAFLLGTVIFILNKFNILQGYFVIKYAQQIGSTLEMIFLSWALASRVKLLQDDYIMKMSSINTTLKRRVDQALRLARQKEQVLIQQSRHAALGEMIGNIAHQWRQPLNALGLLLQNIEFAYQEGALDDRYLARTVEKGKRLTQQMSQTIDDFRDFFKPNKESEIFHVDAALKTVMDIVGSSLNNNQIEIIKEIDHDVCIKGFIGEFSQVLVNLINNAKDILIEKEMLSHKISIRIASKDGKALIEIEDNGGGIPPQIIDKVFDPYFTTKEQGKGTGIGLYMSRVIIEHNMKGELTVENRDNGACFSIILETAPCTEIAIAQPQ